MNPKQHTGYVDGTHAYIYPDSHLHLHTWRFTHHEAPPRLLRSYLWRVVAYSPECLTLCAAWGDDMQIEITHEECRYVIAYEPSWFLKLADHPEEWRWWREAGWNLIVTDYVADAYIDAEDFQDDDAALSRPPGISVRADWSNPADIYRTRRGGGYTALEEVSTHAGAQCFLRELLYCHIHPKKAESLAAANSGRVPTAEVEQMVARLRREDAKRNAPVPRKARRKPPKASE